MPRGAPSFGLVALVAPSLLAIACVRDHDILGKDPPETSGTTSTGMGGTGVGGAGTGGDGGGVPEEPPGPPKLTVVNGVVDAAAIRICFLPYPDAGGEAAAPWPAGTAGLAFAYGAVIAPISDVIPDAPSVQPHVIAGDLAATAGLDCGEILALAAGGQANLIAAVLPVLPASVFEAERSLLLVPVGCLGGPGHTDPAEASACGAGYTADTPTAGLVAAPMSRITEPGSVALQIVHASVAAPTADFRVAPGTEGAPEWQAAPSLSLGAIGPFPPFLSLNATQYGTLSQVQIRTFEPGKTAATSSVPMSEALARSEISAADFMDGRGFVVVAVGAAPGTASGPFWEALTYALVSADP